MRYDAFVRRKIDLEYENLPSTSTPLEDMVRKRELKILKAVSTNESGISHQKLANIIRIDRKNLRPYMERLMGKNLVRRDSGLQGKYYPVKKADLGMSIGADILSRHFLSKILSKEERIFIPDTQYFNTKFTVSSELERFLFEFSNRVGGYITYALIHAMNPANKIAGDTKDDVEKDFNVQSWIGDVMSMIQEYLLPIFKKTASNFFVRVNNWSEDEDEAENIAKCFDSWFNYNMRRPFYTLNEKIVNELTLAFSKLYPSLNYKLDKNRLELPKLVDQEVDRLMFNAEKSKQQEACKHNYKRITNERLLRKQDHNIQHCTKCHKTKRIRPDQPSYS